MPTRELAEHEQACKRSRVRRGDVFQMNVATTVGGRKNPEMVRRPIEVEIVSKDGEKGWVVKSTVSGRLMQVLSSRRFLDWDTYCPGITRPKKKSRKKGDG
jgi:hypothetical protein